MGIFRRSVGRYVKKIDRIHKKWKPVKGRKVSRLNIFREGTDDDCGGDN